MARFGRNATSAAAIVIIGMSAFLTLAIIVGAIVIGAKMISDPASVGSWAAKILGPIINLVK